MALEMILDYRAYRDTESILPFIVFIYIYDGFLGAMHHTALFFIG